MLSIKDLDFPKEKNLEELYAYCFKLHEYLSIILSKKENDGNV